MMVLTGEDMSLLCVYDLGGELSPQNMYSKDHDPDVTKSSTNWNKLDLPIQSALEKHPPYIYDNGVSSTLNISGNYSDDVEGFYSCWLHYPFPSQPGYNTISYGVVTAGTIKEGVYWLQDLILFSLVLALVLVCLTVLWLIAELVFDLKYKSGFYRCRKLKGDEARNVLHNILFSNQGLLILGDEIAAHRAMFRFDKTLQVEERVSRSDIEAEERTSAEEAETSGAEATSDATTEETKTEETKTDETETIEEKTSEESSIDVFEDASDHPNDVKSSITREKIKREDKHRRHSDPIKKSPGSPQKKRNRIVSAPVEETVVNVMTDDDQLSPFTERSKYPRRGKTKEKDVRKGKLLDNQTISLEELQESEDGSSDESPMVQVRTADNFIRVPRDWRKREVKTQTSTPYIGIIQNTSAYRNIENELKFLPEKFKDLGKYEIVNKNVKYK
ncbi:uncharacterized protein LOC124370676 [Homalodisca vitripennis]|uniref:uncharacterized protein LOC124370676 n=1 Tax=Homalodisca vitripennis TaxID=197043 RepID=UPI001EE9ECBA|nr:uncharacterized protein LOC124370676 [Homalodisca vitripennis]